MKNIFKKSIIVGIVFSLIAASEGVYAMVESRPGEAQLTNITIDEMFIRGRRIEQDGEALGLTAIVDQYGNESVSNNIDAHMMKNTEWGAVAYLAQSVYGKGTANSITNNGDKTGGTANGGNYINNVAHSTTQNAYGVYDMYNTTVCYTYMAAHHITYTNTNMSTLFNSRLRYKDIYTTIDLTDIPGGATSETYNWYSQQPINMTASYKNFSASYPTVIRNNSEGYRGVFVYGTRGSNGAASSSYMMRLAVVCGAGL